jgi:hypothetical protein
VRQAGLGWTRCRVSGPAFAAWRLFLLLNLFMTMRRGRLIDVPMKWLPQCCVIQRGYDHFYLAAGKRDHQGAACHRGGGGGGGGQSNRPAECRGRCGCPAYRPRFQPYPHPQASPTFELSASSLSPPPSPPPHPPHPTPSHTYRCSHIDSPLFTVLQPAERLTRPLPCHHAAMDCPPGGRGHQSRQSAAGWAPRIELGVESLCRGCNRASPRPYFANVCRRIRPHTPPALNQGQRQVWASGCWAAPRPQCGCW